MNLSYTTFSVQEKRAEEAIELAIQYGLEGIELRGRDNIHVSPSCTFFYVSELKDTLKRNRLKVPCLTAYTRFHQPSEELVCKEVDELVKMIRLAEYLESPCIRVFMGPVPEGMGEEEAAEIARKGLFYAAEKLKGSSVRLVIETHDSAKDGKTLGKILEGMPLSIGVLLDIIHPWEKGESIEETWKYVGKRIYHVHIKDLKKMGEQGRVYSCIGEGLLPVSETVLFLNQHGYEGFYTLEWEPSAGSEQEGVGFLEQMDSFVSYMRRLERDGNEKTSL